MATPTILRRPTLLLFIATAAGCAGTGGDHPSTSSPAAAAMDPGTPESVFAVLSSRYDADGDGRITRNEYSRSPEAFANLDRDGNGHVDAADDAVTVAMPPDLAAPFVLVRRIAGRDAESLAFAELQEGFARADKDGDGAVSRAEFAGPEDPPGQGRFAVALAAADEDRDGRLGLGEIDSYARRRDRNGDGRLHVRERLVLGEEPPCGWFEPVEREPAPEFRLPREDGSGHVALSDFRGKKAVALIFGSFT